MPRMFLPCFDHRYSPLLYVFAGFEMRALRPAPPAGRVGVCRHVDVLDYVAHGLLVCVPGTVTCVQAAAPHRAALCGM